MEAPKGVCLLPEGVLHQVGALNPLDLGLGQVLTGPLPLPLEVADVLQGLLVLKLKLCLLAGGLGLASVGGSLLGP